MKSSASKNSSQFSFGDYPAKDTIFNDPSNPPKPFTFTPEVAAAFDDMAHRSIPGYITMQQASVFIAGRYAQEGSAIYDLGCSTGNTLSAIAPAIHNRFLPLYGIDSSPAMIEICKDKLSQIYKGPRLHLSTQSVEDCSIKNASVVFMHYVLQFIAVKNRRRILKNIFDGLLPGGAFFISEKILPADDDMQLMEDLYFNFKRKNGYSEIEIEQKKKALEGILIPLPLEETIKLITDAGFQTPFIVCQNYQFVSILAVKP